MSELEQVSTSDTITNDAPIVQDTATEQVEVQEPQTETLTKEQLQEKLNAVGKKEREKSERKFNREMQALRAEFEQVKSAKIEPVKVEGKPSLDQYESYDDYTEALADWKYKVNDAEKSAKQEEEKANEYKTELKKSFMGRIEKFKESTPDYDDVVSEISDIDLSKSVFESLAESDLSAELTYYFGKNIDDLERINKLSPLQAAREIGRIEAKLSTPENKPIKKQSSAPDPVSPVGGSKASVSPDTSKFTDAEWDKYYSEQRRKT